MVLNMNLALLKTLDEQIELMTHNRTEVLVLDPDAILIAVQGTVDLLEQVVLIDALVSRFRIRCLFVPGRVRCGDALRVSSP